MKQTFFVLFVLGAFIGRSQSIIKEDKDFLLHLMGQNKKDFKYILDHRKALEIQIIYTRIDRDTNNRPVFKSFYFNVDSSHYFYPASTVKLPLVLLALEKLNELKADGLDKFSSMLSDSVYSGQQSVKIDTTSESGLPSIAHYVRKILVVSDNDAYNRLYEFIGQKEANRILKQKGYNLRILHRLERPLNADQNRHTEAIRFIKDGRVIYKQPMLVNADSIRPPKNVKKGKGFISNGRLVRKPFDFTYKNFYSLTDQQEILKAILFPHEVELRKRFNLTEDDRRFVLQYMSQLPTETVHPSYRTDTTYYDAYCKFLLFGDSKEKIPSNLRIFNKVGDAYGYMIDNAYIVDFNKGVEFILSAVINTNTDGIYNDNKYDYVKIGYPFMKNLGQLIYHYELKRKRERKPDLSEFQLTYDRP
jgi:hypothetical protein